MGYRLGGRTLDEMPVDLDDLAAAEPVFEELDGWPEPACRRHRRGGEPRGRLRFVQRITELVGIPVWATSWGPGGAADRRHRQPVRSSSIRWFRASAP